MMLGLAWKERSVLKGLVTGLVMLMIKDGCLLGWLRRLIMDN